MNLLAVICTTLEVWTECEFDENSRPSFNLRETQSLIKRSPERAQGSSTLVFESEHRAQTLTASDDAAALPDTDSCLPSKAH